MEQRTYSVRELTRYLRRRVPEVLAVCRRLGVTLTRKETHYADERPRKTAVRHWRRLTREEAERVVTAMRRRGRKRDERPPSERRTA